MPCQESVAARGLDDRPRPQHGPSGQSAELSVWAPRLGLLVTTIDGVEDVWLFQARSGSSNFAPLDLGSYSARWDSLRNRSAGTVDATLGMQDENGLGWSIALDPMPGNSTTKTDLRFHPDGDGLGNGNFNNGTEACIGINTSYHSEFLGRLGAGLQLQGAARVLVLP